MSVQPEILAANGLRDFLLAKLPAKVAEVNAARFAAIRARTPGPYTVPASPNLTLGISVTGNDANFTTVTLTTGPRTTAQLVSQINTAMGATVASADADDHLVLTSPTAPTGSTRSKLWLRGNGTTDCNTAFGWDAGGEKELLTALLAPTRKGCRLGLPPHPDFGPGGTIVCIIGQGKVLLQQPIRKDQHLVELELDVLRIEPEENTSTEGAQQSVRCVRELLLSTEGRQLGRARNGDVMLATIERSAMKFTPMQFVSTSTPPKQILNPWFRGAALQVRVRVNERPSQT